MKVVMGISLNKTLDIQIVVDAVFGFDTDKIFDSFKIYPLINSYSISCPPSNSSDEEKTEPTHTYWIQPCYHLTDVRFRGALGNTLCLFQNAHTKLYSE